MNKLLYNLSSSLRSTITLPVKIVGFAIIGALTTVGLIATTTMIGVNSILFPEKKEITLKEFIDILNEKIKEKLEKQRKSA